MVKGGSPVDKQTNFLSSNTCYYPQVAEVILHQTPGGAGQQETSAGEDCAGDTAEG